MGCCGGDREKAVSVEQKWDYITLSDFKSTNCLAPFSYAWVWILAIITVAVYAADTFTAVNLLAFNKWSSQIQPAIPLNISKWIFSGCIMLSWMLAAYEWQRAIRVIRRGSVAETYLDDVAVVFQSMGIWHGNGWRRFLVFAELTKSRKGVDYIALFVYFQFKGAIRIVLAEGPRQVVNALTLWSVLQADLAPTGTHGSTNGRNKFDQFWFNVEVLAVENREQTVIISSMLFTLFIWAISALSLIIASILYLVFLWHHVPSTDGTLTKYCRRKIDNRLDKVVGKKVRKALDKEQAKLAREERRAKKEGKDMPMHHQPTLPTFEEKEPTVGIARTDTGLTSTTTLSDATTRYQPSLAGDVRPSMPSRNTSGSNFSNSSYRSNAPLLDNADSMGYAEPMPHMPATYNNGPGGMPGPMGPRSVSSSTVTSPIDRPGTSQSMRYQPGPLIPRPGTAFSQAGRNSPAPMGPPMGPPRQMNGTPFQQGPGRNSPAPYGLRGPNPNAIPPRLNTADPYTRSVSPAVSIYSNGPGRRPIPPGQDQGQSYELSPVSPIPSQPFPVQAPYPQRGPQQQRTTYGMPPVDEYFEPTNMSNGMTQMREASPPQARRMSPPQIGPGGYAPFSMKGPNRGPPMRSATNPIPTGPAANLPPRSQTARPWEG